MEKGIRHIPSPGDSVQYISKTVSPIASDSAYPVGTIWINTSSEIAYIHIGLGTWITIGGGSSSGGGGEWGTAESVTISGGIITVLPGCWYKIDTEGAAASDDLDTINGLSEGEQVMLSAANATRTVVLKNGTGNLSIREDISLDDTVDRAILMHDGTNLVEASSRP